MPSSAEQWNPGLLQLVFDLRAEVHGAGDAFDVLHDDGDEPAVGALGLLQAVGEGMYQYALAVRTTRWPFRR